MLVFIDSPRSGPRTGKPEAMKDFSGTFYRMYRLRSWSLTTAFRRSRT